MCVLLDQWTSLTISTLSKFRHIFKAAGEECNCGVPIFLTEGVTQRHQQPQSRQQTRQCRTTDKSELWRTADAEKASSPTPAAPKHPTPRGPTSGVTSNPNTPNLPNFHPPSPFPAPFTQSEPLFPGFHWQDEEPCQCWNPTHTKTMFIFLNLLHCSSPPIPPRMKQPSTKALTEDKCNELACCFNNKKKKNNNNPSG